ncbi:DUF4856 domain-containing protein [Robertkochia sediminum]|uniref:DUF4856 domain-containing protein n=1 Tax=Robertkochia sediminum TaxID=2785326 RepID=UPI0019343A03|nr:DUF4856 domain-containing protein [Robertkochia sediminum]MBL7472539.1 DUF4856 domain-containing protein [Robertkochia sediminum]
MRKRFLGIIALALLTTACSDDDNQMDMGNIQAPSTYEFTRDGASTVSFSGQTTRIQMGEALGKALMDPATSSEALKAMYAHEAGTPNFDDETLNASSKNIRSKVAASRDYFFTNSTLSAAIKQDFETWIDGQANEVFSSWNQEAAAGVPGFIQEAGGGSVRYVNAKGLEYDQIVIKGLIGALMTDQMLNNYLSVSVLDEGANRANNDNGVTEEGKSYTTMEHKWDEAYGYLYGTEGNPASPILGADSFLSKYLGRMEGDPDFAGIAQEIFDAFALGRQAIVEKNYELRDAQADIIREKVSMIIGVRAVYYLEYGKQAFAANDKAAAFHDLSEGVGFIYSLQFTRNPETNQPYFTHEEVTNYLETLLAGNGFWDVEASTLENMAAEIAARFPFTVAEAL